ncbi:MAG: RebB family R body protein [Alphaproteobacteria bacterium]|nr:RebB family R body protein [Alphaproteobacteria bacterium]
MADPTTVNSQVTDAVTQTNTKVLGEAPAMALASVYQATAQALAVAAQNATAAQQNANTVLQATTAEGVARILQSTGAAPSGGKKKKED